MLVDRAREKFNSLLRSSYSARDRVGISDAIIAHPNGAHTSPERGALTPNLIAAPMKNAFAISSLILAVGYSAALAAEIIGAVSFRVPSFSTFISVYVAISILTLAFGDYFRQTSVRANPARRPALRRATAPAVHLISLTNSALHAK